MADGLEKPPENTGKPERPSRMQVKCAIKLIHGLCMCRGV